MQDLSKDVLTAARGLSRRPGFALVVVGTLALGIGANAAIFSVINAALFRPLAVRDESRLLFLDEARLDKANDGGGVSYPDFNDWRSASKTFASLSIVTSDEATLIAKGTPARVRGAVVSANLFETLGVQPALGRTFTADEDFASTSEGLRPIMLTHSAWKTRFNADPAIVGSTVMIDEKAAQVIGVTPAELFPLQKEPVEFWMTVGVNGRPDQKGSANASRGYRAYAGVIGRLAEGATIQSARAELDVLNRSIRAANPKSDQKIIATAQPLREALVGDSSRVLWLLLGVVSLVLLIACVNVANLMLARAATRQREVAIRSALGASRFAIARQMITESGVLAAAGGALGLFLSIWLVRGIVFFLPDGVPQLNGLLPDARVLFFTALVAMATALVCGLFPAISVSRSGLSALTREGGRNGSADSMRARVRSALVVGEVALAVTLLVGAGLLLNSLVRLNRVQPGFDTRGTLTAQLILTGSRYSTNDSSPDRLNQFLDELSARVRAIPGVSDVSYAQSVPLTGIENNTSFDVVEKPLAPGDQPSAQLRFIGADYFTVLGIPLKEGRVFTANDNPRSPDVAVVNEAFVKTHLGGESPIGRHLKLGWGGDAPKEIVGVVGDVRHRSLSDSARPEMYVPQAQFANAGVTLLVRTSASSQISPESLIAPLTAQVRALDPEMPLGEVRSLGSWRGAALALPRFNTALLGVLSLLALVLTIVGLYGVMSYSVAQRAPEMGIRMAVGAKAGDVLRMILGEGMRLVATGIGIGLVAATLLTRLMTSWLYDVSATDPLTLLSISLLLAVVAGLACWIPARRATTVDPMIALRAE